MTSSIETSSTETLSRTALAILIVSWFEALVGIIILSLRWYTAWKILGRIRSDFYIALVTCVSPRKKAFKRPKN